MQSARLDLTHNVPDRAHSLQRKAVWFRHRKRKTAKPQLEAFCYILLVFYVMDPRFKIPVFRPNCTGHCELGGHMNVQPINICTIGYKDLDFFDKMEPRSPH